MYFHGESRDPARKTRYKANLYSQSNYYLIFDPTPFYPPPPPPVLFEIVQEALLLPPRVKLKMLLHRWRGGGAGIEIEGSAKTLKERPRC